VTVFLGSSGDLVTRAEGWPIYCAASVMFHPKLLAVIVNSFRREFPHAEFAAACSLYRHADDQRHRWRAELERHGAGIFITRGEGCPKYADPFAGLTGEHVVGIHLALEIDYLLRLGRPVGWHPIVFPATYWFARFAVQPFAEIQASRYARLLPAPDAELFRPIIGRWPPSDAGGGA
jgi:hypothetical protein